MRTAKILKYLSWGVLLVALLIAFRFYAWTSAFFWLIVFSGLVSVFLLRLFANVGQIVFDMKAESVRSLQNMERSAYHANALLKEIRDLIEEDGDNLS